MLAGRPVKGHVAGVRHGEPDDVVPKPPRSTELTDAFDSRLADPSERLPSGLCMARHTST